jgi:hypothetical protein
MSDLSNETTKTKRTTSTLVGAVAVVVLGGAAAAFGVQACAESTPAPTAPGEPLPSGSTSSSAQPPVTPPVPVTVQPVT